MFFFHRLADSSGFIKCFPTPRKCTIFCHAVLKSPEFEWTDGFNDSSENIWIRIEMWAKKEKGGEKIRKQKLLVECIFVAACVVDHRCLPNSHPRSNSVIYPFLTDFQNYGTEKKSFCQIDHHIMLLWKMWTRGSWVFQIQPSSIVQTRTFSATVFFKFLFTTDNKRPGID